MTTIKHVIVFSYMIILFMVMVKKEFCFIRDKYVQIVSFYIPVAEFSAGVPFLFIILQFKSQILWKEQIIFSYSFSCEYF